MLGLRMRFSKFKSIFLVCTLVVVAVIVVVIVFFEMSPLVLTVDRTSYKVGDHIVITLRNRSLFRTLWFSHTNYNLFFEKWENGSWTIYIVLPGGQMTTPLKPGETVHVDLTWVEFSSGKYRAGASFGFKNDEHYSPGGVAYSQEFTVHE